MRGEAGASHVATSALESGQSLCTQWLSRRREEEALALTKVIVATYDGVGGPRKASKFNDGFVGGPTDKGTYVLAYCGKHSSSRYKKWSRIRWGSALKERGGKIYVQHNGKWRTLSSLTPATREELIQYNKELFGSAKLPKRWVFNDFGHVTCYFFKDKNKNRRLDPKKGEKIHGEFFHTTPPDEADTALGRPFKLSGSHGCIHVKPKEIDEMIKKGYMKRGNTIVIHGYDEKLPSLTQDAAGRTPFEVHFFPGEKKILIFGRPQPAAASQSSSSSRP